MEIMCTPVRFVANRMNSSMKSKITHSFINETAKKHGYQRDTLEKVIRLYYVLKDISETPLLRDNLALKGGTAINLAYFSLPRLSVDIDLDFTQPGKMQDLLPLRQKVKETLFDLLQTQGYTIGKLGKELHTLDQWTFNYKSVTGNNDHIKIELNYGIRNHILPIIHKSINLEIVPDVGIHIPTLHPCELFATKINALIERGAVRDLFDVYSLIRSNILSSPEERELLKKSIVFYQTIGVEGVAKKEIDLSKILSIQPFKIKSQLIPLLPSGKKFFPIDEAKETTMRYLKSLLILSSKEREYMESFSKNIYRPEFLFSDKAIIERIADHPMATWKLQQALNPLESLFNKALKKNDFPQLIQLKEKGYTLTPELIKSLEQSLPANTMIAVKKIFNLESSIPNINEIKLAKSNKPETNREKNNNLNR